MQGPSTQTSEELLDIWLTYSNRITPPGTARTTGGTSCPSKTNAPLPVAGSLIAWSLNEVTTCGGSGNNVPIDGRIDWPFTFATQMIEIPAVNPTSCTALKSCLAIMVFSPLNNMALCLRSSDQ